MNQSIGRVTTKARVRVTSIQILFNKFPRCFFISHRLHFRRKGNLPFLNHSHSQKAMTKKKTQNKKKKMSRVNNKVCDLVLSLPDDELSLLMKYNLSLTHTNTYTLGRLHQWKWKMKKKKETIKYSLSKKERVKNQEERLEYFSINKSEREKGTEFDSFVSFD